MMNDPSGYRQGGNVVWGDSSKTAADYMGWEHELESDRGMGERKRTRRRRAGERDRRVSPTAVPWKVPEGAHTSPASLFLTRQPVLATFSRSVASTSCQRKQRARFVKPKVKLRSNEGTVLRGGTSGFTPAAGMRRSLNAKHQPLSHSHRNIQKKKTWKSHIGPFLTPLHFLL